MQNLKHGIERGANSAAGWKALAELQYQNRQFQDAYDTAVNGLEWSVKRRRAGHEQLTSFALALRLVVAQCLRRLQRLDEAEYNFQVLAGKFITELPGQHHLSVHFADFTLSPAFILTPPHCHNCFFCNHDTIIVGAGLLYHAILLSTLVLHNHFDFTSGYAQKV